MALNQYGIYLGYNSNYITQTGNFTQSNTVTFKIDNGTISFISDISNLIINGRTEFNLRPVIKNYFGYDVNPTITNFSSCTNSVTQFMNICVNKNGLTYSKINCGVQLFLNSNLDEYDYLSFDSDLYKMSSSTSSFLNLHQSPKYIQSNENETLSFIQNINYRLDKAEYVFYKNNSIVDTYDLNYSEEQNAVLNLSYTYSTDEYVVSGTADVITDTAAIRLDIPSGTHNLSSFTTYSYDEYHIKLFGTSYNNNRVSPIIANRGEFDNLNGITFTNYLFGLPTTMNYTYSRTSSKFNVAPSSLFIGSTNASINDVLYISVPLTLTPETTYIVSYYYYSDLNEADSTFVDDASIQVDLSEFDDCTILSPIPSVAYSNYNSPRKFWTKVSGKFKTGGVSSANLNLIVFQGLESEYTNKGNVYIDTLKVEGSGSQQQISEERVFKVNDICTKYENVRVVWTNKFGATEYYTMQLIDKVTNIKKDSYYKALDASYTYKDRGQTTYFIQTNKTYKLSTNWLNAEQDEFIQSIFTSPNIYFESEGKLIPVVLTDSTIQHRIKGVNKVFSYELSFNNSIKNNSNV